MNNYTITGFDYNTNAIYVIFTYGNHVLNHTSFVSDLTDSNGVFFQIQSDYQNFVLQMDTIDKKTGENIPATITSIINVPQQVIISGGTIQFVSIAPSPAPPIMEPPVLA